MKQRKKLKELTIRDNFMFGAVMTDEENCRSFLELALGFPIERVVVSKEKSIVYHPEYRGVRLDIYAKDSRNTHYNVEMQVAKKDALGKRSRYYHSQLDMDLLLSGNDYTELPDVYVIFICDFDPFGKQKYRYTFENRCLEDGGLQLQEGCRSVFLSTSGRNEAEVPAELVKFLKFVRADLEESRRDFADEFVKRLQKSLEEIRESREMEERFMILEEMLQEERAEGMAEGIAKGQALSVLEILEDLGSVPEELENRIKSEQDPEILKEWLRKAVRVETVEQFSEEI